MQSIMHEKAIVMPCRALIKAAAFEIPQLRNSFGEVGRYKLIHYFFMIEMYGLLLPTIIESVVSTTVLMMQLYRDGTKTHFISS